MEMVVDMSYRLSAANPRLFCSFFEYLAKSLDMDR